MGEGEQPSVHSSRIEPTIMLTLPIQQQHAPPAALLPPLFATWMSELLGGPIPAESTATCDDCAMCRTSDRMLTAHAKTFRPDVKCCSYMPHLPNFAVGGVLIDSSAEGVVGRATVQQRIDAKIGVSPIGLDMSPPYGVLYASSRHDAFGVSRALRCPHYVDEGGRCGIWRYRNSVCSTYHCKFVRGSVGRAFWIRLYQLLAEVESNLERWCVSELQLGEEVLRQLIKLDSWTHTDGPRLTAAALDGECDPAMYRRLWGDRWFGHERDFYIASCRLAESLSWTDMEAIGGAKLGLYSRVTRDAYNQLMDWHVPDPLKCGDFSARVAQPGFVALQAYSAQDQLLVPQAFLTALSLFDGERPTARVIETLRDRGVTLSVAFVRRLVDFAVLVPSTHVQDVDRVPS